MSATGDLGVITSKNTYEKQGEKSATLYSSCLVFVPSPLQTLPCRGQLCLRFASQLTLRQSPIFVM
jgi:hypothetical protein